MEKQHKRPYRRAMRINPEKNIIKTTKYFMGLIWDYEELINKRESQKFIKKTVFNKKTIKSRRFEKKKKEKVQEKTIEKKFRDPLRITW